MGSSSRKLGGLDSANAAPIPEISEVRLLRAADELETRLRDVADIDKALRIALRSAAELLDAPHRCVALLSPGRAEPSIDAMVPPGSAADWPALELARFARGERPELPEEVAVARLRRRRRPWGTVAMRWPNRKPFWNTRHALTRLISVANEQIDRIEMRRLAEVRARIDRKIIEQLRPKDLLYQVLDGLRSLTGYDHFGTVLLRSEHAPAFELVAEQLAYRKGKSGRIGAAVVIPSALSTSLARGTARGFSRRSDRWQAWDADADASVAEWLDTALPPLPVDAPLAQELIAAPLTAAGEVLGVLVLAARHAGTFWPYECELVDALLPHAMISLRNARRAESLEAQVIQSERKHAMAELARGVSHDVNNALGAMLPLVQQLRAEAESGRLESTTVHEDLVSIERAVQACVRIFSNMLQFARRTADETPDANARLDLAIDAVLAIHADGLRRHGIAVRCEVDPGMPTLPLRQAELEQVMLNVVANARDAIISAGGRGEIVVAAALSRADDAAATGEGRTQARIEISDDGVGIDGAHLSRVIEPFFTTKPRGNGLGLSICRAILWQCRGRIAVASPRIEVADGRDTSGERRGTTVTIEIPLRSVDASA